MGKDVKGEANHGEPVTQPSWHPTAKVLATWVTGSGATVVTAALVALTEQVDQETFWGVLVASVVTGLAGWLKRSRPSA